MAGSVHAHEPPQESKRKEKKRKEKKRHRVLSKSESTRWVGVLGVRVLPRVQGDQMHPSPFFAHLCPQPTPTGVEVEVTPLELKKLLQITFAQGNSQACPHINARGEINLSIGYGPRRFRADFARSVEVEHV